MRTTVLLAALLALAGPPHALAGEAKRCHYPPVVDLPIRYVGAGLAPAVDATINKTPATMLLDTGSYTTALTMTGVARRGLPLRATDGAATGISGVTRVYATHVKAFGIGPKQWNRSVDMAVIGETTYTPDYDGLFGAPFLLQWDLMLDLRAKRMKMYLPQDCDDTELYLWDEDTFVVPTLGKVNDNPNPLFKVRLYLARLRNGEADLGRRELQALLDKQQMDDWPYPVAQYFLGKWDAGRVLAQAAKDKAFAQERTRQADIYLAEWRAAQGDAARTPAPH